MLKPRLETLKSINAEFLGGRWADDDLQQLIRPAFGVVSSLASVLADLRGIVAKDLGDVAPHARAAAPNFDDD